MLKERDAGLKEKKQIKKSNNRLFPRKNAYKILMLLMGAVAIAFLVMLIVVDTLPADLTIIVEIIIAGMLVLTSIMLGREKRWKRIAGILIAALFIVIFGVGTSYLGSTYAMLNNISNASIRATGPKAQTVDLVNEPFNIYITGIDQWEEEEGLDLERSDVNMIVTVNPLTKEVLLTSIPRDSYVKLHTAQQMDKLTHTGIYGVDETLKTVEDWFGIKLNYYVKMNFNAAIDIIAAIDGIQVYSPVAFESSLKGYKYKKGWNRLGGSKALYFARERKAFEGQDAIRVENQQRVVKAVIKKMTSHTTLLTKYGDIMAAAGKNLETNMTSEEMLSLVKMQITDVSPWDIKTQKVDGDYDEDYVASLTQKQKFSIYRTDEKSVEKCKNKIEEVLNPSNEKIESARSSRSRSFLVNLANSTVESIKKKSETEESE